MQTKMLIFYLFIFIILFTSCKFDRSLLLSKLVNEESQKIQCMSEEIIRCFTKKDKESFKKLFCQKIRNQPGFNDEINRAFDFFNCYSYTTSKIDTSSGGGESTEYGKRTKWYVSPSIPYIQVLISKNVKDKDPSPDDLEYRYYGISYFWSIIDEKDKSLEGLQYVKIELLNIKSIEIGKGEFMQ